MQSPLGQGVIFQIYFLDITSILSALRACDWPTYLGPYEVWRKVVTARPPSRRCLGAGSSYCIVLVIEMTAGFPMPLPMIAACFAAMLVPNLLHGIPIYDSLRERVYRVQQSEAGSAATQAASAQAENIR